MASGSAFSATAGSIGGFFGDIIEGIKPDVIDALGFRIRDAAGILPTGNGITFPQERPPLNPPPTQAAGTVKIDDLVGLGVMLLIGYAAYELVT